MRKNNNQSTNNNNTNANYLNRGNWAAGSPQQPRALYPGRNQGAIPSRFNPGIQSQNQPRTASYSLRQSVTNQHPPQQQQHQQSQHPAQIQQGYRPQGQNRASAAHQIFSQQFNQPSYQQPWQQASNQAQKRVQQKGAMARTKKNQSSRKANKPVNSIQPIQKKLQNGHPSLHTKANQYYGQPNPLSSNLPIQQLPANSLWNSKRSTQISQQSGGEGPRNQLTTWALQEEILTNVAAPTTQTGKKIDIDLEQCLSINARLGSDAIKAKTTKQTIPLLLNLKEVNFDNLGIEIDSKIDLVCVIDISGSMSGQKMQYVQQTMKGLLGFLGNGHRLAIVTFNQTSKTVMNFKRVNAANMSNINKTINLLRAGGGTNITAGVHEAQRLLGNRKSKNHTSCIFLLSDGQHCSGPINMDILYKGDTQRTKCEYTLTSFGYGDDHDAKLMQEMSEKKGGNYYFVNDISKVEDCFADSLAMVTSILGQNLRATLRLNPTRLFPEIRFEKTYGPYWTSTSPIERQIKVSSFYSGFDKNFLCLLGLNPLKPGQLTQETEIHIGDLFINIDTLDSPSSTYNARRAIKLRILPQDSEEIIVENQIVHEQLVRVQGAEAIDAAEQLNNARNYDQAMQVLDRFSSNLSKQKFKKKELFVKMQETIDKQKEMISNNKIGRANAYKTANFCAQTKNIFMNEQAAPQWHQGLYQNCKQKRVSGY